MQFGRWYPLGEVAAHAPAAPGVFQVRVEHGLLDYPRGKTAMVHYAYADDVRAAAIAWAATARPGLLCRHLVEIAPDDASGLRAFHAKLVADFARRFGVAPSPPPP